MMTMIYTPFDFWLGVMRTGQKMSATMDASKAVIDSRMQTMAHAARDPLRGDYQELGLMVPEKVEAFSRAGASVMKDALAIQSAAMANWNALAAMAWRPATLGDWVGIADRTAGMAKRAGQSGGRALAPVHRAATGNARRLNRKR
jgi:hypothetical protein